jgi:endonuclease YncB( thermonuclease family)
MDQQVFFPLFTTLLKTKIPSNIFSVKCPPRPIQPSLTLLTNYVIFTSFHFSTLLDSFLQLVLSLFSATPVASAETLEEQVWPTKHIIEITEETDYPSKTELTNLTDQTLYWVVAVLDGDTLLVSAPDRSLFQVRLLAVDTNEVNGPDSTAECYGPEAAEFTLEFLKNRAVLLSSDPANQDLDPYGRKLRYVDALQKDGSFLRLNDALLLEGMATYPDQYPTSTPDYFKALEKAAQEAEKGLWGAC